MCMKDTLFVVLIPLLVFYNHCDIRCLIFLYSVTVIVLRKIECCLIKYCEYCYVLQTQVFTSNILKVNTEK